MPDLLRLTNVAKAYGGLSVFEDVTLDVAHGARLGVLGPNGAGKSTLFNLLSGLQRPSGGTIGYDGRPLDGGRPWAACRAGIGRTFQIPRPFAGLDVEHNVMVGLTSGLGLSMSVARERARETLERTGLARHAHRLAGDLPLLDLKRLELARAAALEPRLLLLDEIAGGLTEGECGELLEILETVTQADTTVIWIEHVVHALVRYVHEIAVLADKRIVTRGDIDSVLAHPDVRRLYFGSDGPAAATGPVGGSPGAGEASA